MRGDLWKLAQGSCCLDSNSAQATNRKFCNTCRFACVLRSPVSLKHHVSHHLCCQFTCVARFHAAKPMFFKHDALHSFCCPIISVTMHTLHVRVQQVVRCTCTCGSNAQVDAVLLSTSFIFAMKAGPARKKTTGGIQQRQQQAMEAGQTKSTLHELLMMYYAQGILSARICHSIARASSQDLEKAREGFRMPDLERISVLEHGKNLQRSFGTRVAKLSTLPSPFDIDIPMKGQVEGVPRSFPSCQLEN